MHCLLWSISHEKSLRRRLYTSCEGTGDLENDTDNLIYFIPSHDDEGVLVSTICKPAEGMGKMRASIEKMSWRITKDRQVVALDDYQDTEAMQAATAQRVVDETYIEAITLAIEAGQHKQVDICTWCKEQHGHSEKRVREVLIRWSGQLWSRKGGYAKNAVWHELL